MDRSAIRARMLDELALLSQPAQQLKYESTLQAHAGHAPTELVNGFGDIVDLKNSAFTDAFSSDELRWIAQLYGLIIEAGRNSHSSVASLLKDPVWRRVLTLAQQLGDRLQHGA